MSLRNVTRILPSVCYEPISIGICRASFVRYAFNVEKQKCMPFAFGGCGGNSNMFRSIAHCNSQQQQKWQKLPKQENTMVSVPNIILYLSASSLDPWGPGTLSLFKDLSKRLRDTTAGSFLAQGISLTIQRGNAASIFGTMPQGLASKMVVAIRADLAQGPTTCKNENATKMNYEDAQPDWARVGTRRLELRGRLCPVVGPIYTGWDDGDDDYASTLRIAVGLRLGVGICASHNCVSCGAPVDRLGHHGLSCSSGAGRLSRHAALNDILRIALAITSTYECQKKNYQRSSVNVPAALEPQIVRSDGKRPDGMSLIPWKTGRALVWDATCTDTLAASYLPATTKCAGAAADARKRLKVTKYSCLSAQYHFFAFGVETLGPWGKGALELHRELSNRLREATGKTRAGSFLAQRISIAVQRGNAACVMGTKKRDGPPIDVKQQAQARNTLSEDGDQNHIMWVERRGAPAHRGALRNRGRRVSPGPRRSAVLAPAPPQRHRGSHSTLRTAVNMNNRNTFPPQPDRVNKNTYN
ncbi:hypothetical protein MSG28_015107 [Choristoneura fumiferana]|uniref:Uncharacterized protein n=1 Tax=Choristoneura fumiferana TaxID=7141 RepID=A0ACC0KYU4_CHOFU|nr:hypothetical protein MSG28_015107 [Choristoneura fumiferana]